MQEANRLRGLRETARLIGISPSWLLSEVDKGRIPCLRTDNAILFNITAVQHALLRLAAGDEDSGATDAEHDA